MVAIYDSHTDGIQRFIEAEHHPTGTEVVDTHRLLQEHDPHSILFGTSELGVDERFERLVNLVIAGVGGRIYRLDLGVGYLWLAVDALFETSELGLADHLSLYLLEVGRLCLIKLLL